MLLGKNSIHSLKQLYVDEISWGQLHERRKIMRRNLLVIGTLLVTALLLVGCSKTGKCEECGQTEKLKKYVLSDGDTEYVCEDCSRWMKMLGA